MTNLTRVTITGPEDSTSIAELIRLSQEFPFVEWGILVSESKEGHGRFPSRAWIDRFVEETRDVPMNVSTHICGRWVRELLIGQLNFAELPLCISRSQRVQINTHSRAHLAIVGFGEKLKELPERQIIFQWDGVNDALAFSAMNYGINAAALFDKSGGAGVLPESWPTPHDVIPCGYAGGLGPENVVAEIAKIEAVCDRPYWIDMERRVRTEDDTKLDLKKVERVLRACAPLIAHGVT